MRPHVSRPARRWGWLCGGEAVVGLWWGGTPGCIHAVVEHWPSNAAYGKPRCVSSSVSVKEMGVTAVADIAHKSIEEAVKRHAELRGPSFQARFFVADCSRVRPSCAFARF